MNDKLQARFELGTIAATIGAINAVQGDATLCAMLISRHAGGDWGELDSEDRDTNERAIKRGGRIMSAYTLFHGPKLWIITESDRSVTTILTPDEY